MRARTLLLFMILVGTLTITPVAAAQTSPTDDAYNRESLGVIGEIQTEEPTPPSTTEITPEPPGTPPGEEPEGELPFTGFEVGAIALGGILLLGTGLLLRRRLGSREA